MAFATDTRAASISLGARFAEIRAQFQEAMEARRVYRRTLNELAQLSNRDLADLGIGRCEIRGIALEAAYGKAA
ncbi:DUF1127 domain-containing protein [Nioella nitratireducens]|uniref:DUF1127 domain-containing protein n=1 Tax=Nioella nitratireducens TaxID=1287720 RepID=UPI0008FD685A|nr:DUF1127 domain-containing protein [Nioella nitratireducens]